MVDVMNNTAVTHSLSWNNHLQAVSSGLCSLQQNEELVDMTLAADGHFVKVHKVIMAMASPYIKELICSIKCDHPVIFLNKVSYSTLTFILEYIYTGEVNITSESIDEFLTAAKCLHIKGLNNVSMDNEIITPDEKNKTIEKIAISDFNLDDESEDGNGLAIELAKESMKQSMYEISSNFNTGDLDSDVHYTLTKHGSLQMIWKKFMYYLKHTNKDNSRQWRCVDYLNKNKCPAFIFTEGDVVVHRKTSHNHKSHENKIRKRIRSGNVLSKICDAEKIMSTKTIKDYSNIYIDDE